LVSILVTGGFGNIGALVDECLRRGHAVSVFEVQNGRTAKLARKYSKRNVQVLFGDLRKAEDVSRAVVGRDIVLHLAAILPPVSNAQPDLCRAVNVGGTANLIEGEKRPRCRMKDAERPPRPGLSCCSHPCPHPGPGAIWP
jgi:nucleoside-diphosphate-sugar epimerase